MKKKYKGLGIISLVMALILMGVIFYFSSQNGESSYSATGKVLTAVTGEPVTQADWDSRTPWISAARKSAHLFLFFFVGLFLYIGIFNSFEGLRRKSSALAALAFGAAYSAADELHQSFVPGRGASMSDVFIDSLGVGAGIAFAIAVMWILWLLAARREKPNEYKAF